MNRRKKEADQHKGWNISISGVFIAMVMGIVLISVVAATLIFVQIYRNAMEQSAVTSSSQSCEQVQNTVENYTQDMRIILEGIVARMRHENNHSEEYIQNLVNIRSDVVAVTICGEDGELLRYWNRGQKLKEKSKKTLDLPICFIFQILVSYCGTFFFLILTVTIRNVKGIELELLTSVFLTLPIMLMM